MIDKVCPYTLGLPPCTPLKTSGHLKYVLTFRQLDQVVQYSAYGSYSCIIRTSTRIYRSSVIVLLTYLLVQARLVNQVLICVKELVLGFFPKAFSQITISQEATSIYLSIIPSMMIVN